MTKPLHPNAPQNNERTRAAVEGFHEHLDGCRRCASQPFNLCDVGANLLHASGFAPGVIEPRARKGSSRS
jgi:hypothetical protein